LRTPTWEEVLKAPGGKKKKKKKKKGEKKRKTGPGFVMLHRFQGNFRSCNNQASRNGGKGKGKGRRKKKKEKKSEVAFYLSSWLAKNALV